MATVLLNGWSASRACWQHALDSHVLFSDWEVWDLHDFPDWDALATALDRHLGAGDTLAGWSMGGMLALRYAAARPTCRLAGLITLNANLRFVANEAYPTALAPEVFDAFAQRVASADAAGLARHFSALMLRGGAAADRQALRALYHAEALPERSQLLDLLACLGTIDVRGVSKADLPPCLHLFGRHDALVPVAASSAMSCVTGGEVSQYDGAHVPFLFAWPHVAPAIIRFIEACRSVSA